MNIHKHMETIFVTTLAVIGVGAIVIDGISEAEARPLTQTTPVERAIATPGSMAVVVVRAPRPARQD
jgi:hypothetical protein